MTDGKKTIRRTKLQSKMSLFWKTLANLNASFSMGLVTENSFCYDVIHSAYP